MGLAKSKNEMDVYPRASNEFYNFLNVGDGDRSLPLECALNGCWDFNNFKKIDLKILNYLKTDVRHLFLQISAAAEMESGIRRPHAEVSWMLTSVISFVDARNSFRKY